MSQDIEIVDQNSESIQKLLQQESDAAKIRDTRIVCLLGSLFLVSACWLDPAFLPSALAPVWIARTFCVCVLLAILVATRSSNFIALYGWLISAAYIVMGIAVNSAIYFAAADELAVRFYFVGLMLMIMGIYTWVHLPPLLTNLNAGFSVVCYGLIVIFHHHLLSSESQMMLASHFYALVGSMLIGHISQSNRLKYIAQAYRSRFALHEDLASQEQARQAIEFTAFHDPLTELPNRVGLSNHAAHALAESAAGRNYVLLFLDLNGFKPINDRFGHQIGDQVLRLIAQRLRISIRSNDYVARLGGDEFVVLAHREGPIEDVRDRLVENIKRAVSQPIQIADAVLRVTTSVGSASFPQDATSLDGLIEIADTRMYAEKHAAGDTFSNLESILSEETLDNVSA